MSLLKLGFDAIAAETALLYRLVRNENGDSRVI